MTRAVAGTLSMLAAIVVSLFVVLKAQDSVWQAAVIVGIALLANNVFITLQILLSARRGWLAAAYMASLTGTAAWVWGTDDKHVNGFLGAILFASLTIYAVPVVIGVAVSLASAIKGQQRAAEFEDHVCYLLCYSRHYPLFHKEHWGDPAVVRHLESNLSALATLVRRRLPFRLSPSNPAKRRAMLPMARSIATRWSDFPDLVSEDGRTALLRANETALWQADRAEWFSMTDVGPMATPSMVAREIGFIISTVTPLIIFVVLGRYVSDAWGVGVYVSVAWLLLSLLSRFDPGLHDRLETFGRIRREGLAAVAESTNIRNK